MKLLFYVILVCLPFFFGCKSKKDSQTTTEYANRKAFKEVFHEANSEKMIGHNEKAIALFNQCLNLDPQSAASYFALSEIYLSQKENGKAIEYAQECLKLNPNNKWYLIHLADLYYNNGIYENGAKLYERLFTEFDEKNIDYRLKFTESLIFSSQFKKAIDQLNIIELENGKSPQIALTKHDLYLQLGDKNAAENEIESLLLEFPTDIGIKTTLLDYFLQTNQADKAQQMINEILNISPQNPTALIAQADLKMQNNQIDSAFVFLNQAFDSPEIESDQRISVLSTLMSFSNHASLPKSFKTKLGDLFTKAQTSEEENASFLVLYAHYLEENYQYEKAAQLYRLATEDSKTYVNFKNLLYADYNGEKFNQLVIDGENAMTYHPAQPLFYLLTAVGAIESHQLDKAEEYLVLGKDFVVENPDLLADFEFYLGNIAYVNGNKTQAKTQFEKAKTINPYSNKISLQLAEFYLKHQDLNEALKEINISISLNPNDADAYDVKGNILMAQKNYSQAILAYKKAIIIQYENPTYLEHLGDALYFNGETENAIEIWKEAVKYGSLSKTIERKISDKTYYEN